MTRYEATDLCSTTDRSIYQMVLMIVLGELSPMTELSYNWLYFEQCLSHCSKRVNIGTVSPPLLMLNYNRPYYRPSPTGGLLVSARREEKRELRRFLKKSNSRKERNDFIEVKSSKADKDTTWASLENGGKRFRHVQRNKVEDYRKCSEEKWRLGHKTTVLQKSTHVHCIYCNASFRGIHPHLLICMHFIYIFKFNYTERDNMYVKTMFTAEWVYLRICKTNLNCLNFWDMN